MSRFYIEGEEIDVQDITFFIQEEKYREIKETIDNTLADYA